MSGVVMPRQPGEMKPHATSHQEISLMGRDMASPDHASWLPRTFRHWTLFVCQILWPGKSDERIVWNFNFSTKLILMNLNDISDLHFVLHDRQVSYCEIDDKMPPGHCSTRFDPGQYPLQGFAFHLICSMQSAIPASSMLICA